MVVPLEHIADAAESYEDIVGTGALLKKVIKNGNGGRPMDNDVIKISLDYYGLKDSSPNEMTFILGYLLNIEGIELACKFMEVGEEAIFKIKSHLAYGESGLSLDSCNIPPYHDLIVKISLVSIQERQKVFLHSPVNELLVYCQKFRSRGKFYFERNELDRAMFIYNKVLNILGNRSSDKPDANLLVELSIFQNNLATCHFKLNDLKKALEISTAAVFSNPKNIGAMYKHLIILESLKRYDEGISFIQERIVNLPSEKDLLERKLCKFMAYQKEVDDSEREVFKKMMQ
uniref:peptidylprolyl isomerase n=1 Tax=Strongyloides venezuelensis TaxID=75913 RepID=A0A0K0G1U3_STRVS